MKSMSIVAIVLIVLGVVGLVSGHISYTTREEVLHIGPIKATADEKHVISIPEVAGVAALVAGIVLLVVGTRRT